MAFIFPEDKADFTAPNGITYSFDGTKWVTKTFNAGGGEAGKESTPYVDWQQFKVIERTDRYDYDPLFDTNPIAQTAWEYQIDILGSGDTGFVNIVDLSDSIKSDIGWYGSMSVSHLRLNKTAAQERIYGSAQVRFKITTELNGVENVEYSCSLPAWESGECSYPSSLAALTQRVSEGEEVQEQIKHAVQEGIEEQNKIKLGLEELQVTKGSVARYKIAGTSIGVAGRDGELYVNNAVAADVGAMSFAPFDLNGQPLKPCNVGDIIELVEAVALATVGEVTRYRIVSGEPQALNVEYLSGTNDFVVDEFQEVYIYPQNEVGASKDYVDAQDATKVSKSGDTMTGALTVQNTVLLSHDDGKKQLKLSPNHSDYFTNIYAYNGGGMRFRVAPENAETDYKTAVSIAYVTHTVDGNTYPVETAVNWLRNPTQPHHAANKAYVDANSGGGGGIKLDLWTYKGPKSDGNSLGDGEFASKKLAGGVLELYLGRRNSRGVFYHPTPANSTAEYYHQVTQSSQNGSPLTITQQDGRCVWFAETKKLIFNKSSANYSVIEAIHYRGAVDLLIEGNQYMLNVPGLIGPVSGW